MIDPYSHKMNHVDISLLPRNMVAECRICHDEDETANLEAPCACCGSLKFAHRKCVQRWCNEKGDTTCEICGQHYRPGYTAPSRFSRFGTVQMPLRGNWELPRRNHHNPYFISMVASNHDLLEPVFDVYTSSRSIICYRIFAVIFITLLVLRHILPIINNGTGEYSFTLYMLLVLRTCGILLPILVMLKLCHEVHQRRRHRWRGAATFNTVVASSEENYLPRTLPQLRLIHVQ